MAPSHAAAVERAVLAVEGALKGQGPLGMVVFSTGAERDDEQRGYPAATKP